MTETRPVHFPEANRVLTKPEGMTDEECGELPTMGKWKPWDEVGRAVHRRLLRDGYRWNRRTFQYERRGRDGRLLAFVHIRCLLEMPIN